MNYRWLLAFYNFCGVCFIKVTNNNQWKESKIFIIFGFLKIILLFILITLFLLSDEFLKKFFNQEVVQLTKYSEFSKNLLNLGAECFFLCCFIIFGVQFIRRKKIMKFFKAIDAYELKNDSKLKLFKAYKSTMIVNSGMNLIAIFIRNVKILRNDYLPAYIIWFLTIQLYFVIASVFIFFCNFQQFIIVALRNIKDELEIFLWNNKKFDELMTNLIKIDNFMETFENIFGLQLTIISINFVFSTVIYVRL